MKMKKSLKRLRRKIDSIDSSIVSLLSARAGFVREIGLHKITSNQAEYIPSREKEVFRNIKNTAKDTIPSEILKNIYREILSSMRSLEKKSRICFLGPKATFTHQAAVKIFGKYVDYLPVASIEDVFTAVASGEADYGVVPVENTSEGVVNYTLDMFLESDLKIYSEILLEIDHYLAARCPVDKIKKVYSHYQALAQCRNWLSSRLPGRKIIAVDSTARAAGQAAGEKYSAAVCSRNASLEYGLNIVASRIQDHPNNFTRFLVIADRIANRSGDDKTSVLFSIKDRVGALYDMLLPFKRQKINLTKIESRPTKKKAWEYVFFVDVEGHYTDRKLKIALKELSKSCIFLKILGSYPKGE